MLCETCKGFGCDCCTRAVDTDGNVLGLRSSVCRYRPCDECGGTGVRSERVVGVALRHESKLWTLPAPARHDSILRHAYERSGDRNVPGHGEQGFCDEAGRFLTRQHAVRVALRSGQIKEPKRILYSEDVW